MRPRGRFGRGGINLWSDSNRRFRDPAIPSIPRDWIPSCFPNGLFEGFLTLALRRFGTRHVEDFLLHDCPVQVINAVVQGKRRERQAKADPVRRNVLKIVQIQTTDSECSKFVGGRCGRDVCEIGGFRHKGKGNEGGESLGAILQCTKEA